MDHEEMKKVLREADGGWRADFLSSSEVWAVGALYNRREEVSRGPFSHAEMNLDNVNARIQEENEDHKILVLQVKGDQVLYCLVFGRNNFVRRENARHMHCSVEAFDAQFVLHSNFPASKTHTPEA